MRFRERIELQVSAQNPMRDGRRLIFTHRPPTPLRSTPNRKSPRVYHVRHEANRKAPEPRLPPFTAVGWLTPRRSLSTTTQTHTPPYSNVPWSWTRRVPQCLCLSSGVLNWAANVGVLSSPTRTGVRASRPPVGGLAFLRHVRLGAIMCSPPPLWGWGRAALPL